MGNLGGWRALTFWSNETRISGIEGECAELLRMLQPRKMSERYSAPRRRVCTRYLTMDAGVHARVRNGTWEGNNKEVSRDVARFFYLLTSSP